MKCHKCGHYVAQEYGRLVEVDGVMVFECVGCQT
jgi:hypothetical protein